MGRGLIDEIAVHREVINLAWLGIVFYRNLMLMLAISLKRRGFNESYFIISYRVYVSRQPRFCFSCLVQCSSRSHTQWARLLRRVGTFEPVPSVATLLCLNVFILAQEISVDQLVASLKDCHCLEQQVYFQYPRHSIFWIFRSTGVTRPLKQQQH